MSGTEDAEFRTIASIRSSGDNLRTGMTPTRNNAWQVIMKSDVELRLNVEKDLASNLKVDSRGIAVAVDNAVATLTGQVRSYAVKWEAESTVRQIMGVVAIVNTLSVTPDEEQPDDVELRESVVRALESNVFIPSETIRCAIHDGWVTLTGKALYYYERLDAEGAVRALRGVRGITDSIVIDNPDPPQDLNQTIISNALSRNVRLDARRITVKTIGRTAILQGSVRSLAERDQAEMAAWSAPGVSSVENHLEVR